MMIIERGQGTPIVMIPGIQGRWPYMTAAVDALSRHYRVVTFDLCGEPGCGRFTPRKGIDNYVEQVESVLDRLGLERAVVCGVSFGGLIAVRFAAQKAARVSALLLVSAPGPGFHLRKRHELYARLPWLFGPAFLAELPRRVNAELRAAIPHPRRRLGFSWRQAATFFRAPVSVSRMAVRARLIGSLDVPAACAAIEAPTLVMSGEPSLDHVVSVHGTSEYARLIRDARAVTLNGTGHLGYITKPDLFASIVHDFVTQRDVRVNDAA